MAYLADVTNALSQSNGQGPSHLSVDGEERAIEVDSDWVEELAVEEEDSQAEDSVSGVTPTVMADRHSQSSRYQAFGLLFWPLCASGLFPVLVAYSELS